jgi:hypothetical protein
MIVGEDIGLVRQQAVLGSEHETGPLANRDEMGNCLDEDLDQVMSLSVKAPFMLTQALYPLRKGNAPAATSFHFARNFN